MRNKKIQNIKTLLENSALSKIMQKSTALSTLNKQLEQLFPPELKGLYRVANVENDVLTLEVKNAVVRQAMLFRQQELLQAVKQASADISEIKIKVSPTM